jgi:hypothetical protein
VTPTFLRGLAALALTLAAGAGEAAEWQYSLGAHDTAVPDVDSHTYGIGGHADVDGMTSAGRHLFGAFDVFLDHDEDHLDPDHIPVWWQTHLGMDGEFWKGSRKAFIGWTIDENTRMNTVSSIERQIHVLPAFAGGFDGDSFQASLKAGVGYLFLEIDDDAPRLRGYDRTNLRQTTSAGSLGADTTIRIGDSWEVFGHAEEWWDSDDWIQNQWIAGFRVATERWAKGSKVVFTAEANEYNLDSYSTPGLPPVLAWDDDLLFRLDFLFVRPRSRARE